LSPLGSPARAQIERHLKDWFASAQNRRRGIPVFAAKSLARGTRFVPDSLRWRETDSNLRFRYGSTLVLRLESRPPLTGSRPGTEVRIHLPPAKSLRTPVQTSKRGNMSEHPPPQEARWPDGAIFTFGHSTLPIECFAALLRTYGIERLVDIRTIPARGMPHDWRPVRQCSTTTRWASPNSQTGYGRARHAILRASSHSSDTRAAPSSWPRAGLVGAGLVG
jgi:hypothetical protein